MTIYMTGKDYIEKVKIIFKERSEEIREDRRNVTDIPFTRLLLCLHGLQNKMTPEALFEQYKNDYGI